MKSELETLPNIGPKMASYLQIIELHTPSDFYALGAHATAKKLFSTSIVKPHFMYYLCLCAAEKDRSIFSFNSAEKGELSAQFKDLLAEIGKA